MRKIVDDLYEGKLNPVGVGNMMLCSEICQRYDRSYLRDARELAGLLRNCDFKALLTAHDIVADQYLELLKLNPSKSTQESEVAPWEEIGIGTGMRHNQDVFENPHHDQDESDSTSNVWYGQPTRIISLRKVPGQPLGVTVEETEGNLVVARILSGSMMDRMSLLKVGDAILEVNSKKVSSPDQLQQEILKARDTLRLRVASPAEDKNGVSILKPGMPKPMEYKTTAIEGQKTLCFMMALFSYDPSLDNLLPCKEIGLKFQMGEILHIVNQSDPNWWQAKKVGENLVGLIPSRELEERRAAFVRPEADFVHSVGVCGTRIARKKKRCLYTAKQNADFDRAELVLYEEVTRMPPFRRKTLVLVGTNGVGRRTLKNRLLNLDEHKFGAVLPVTSRPPRQGEEQMNNYVFVTREEFEEGIRGNRFLEFGEKDGHYYGTSYDSVRDVIRKGKLCIIDCGPSILKILRNSPEFMPYVVFLAAPGADQIRQQDDFERQHGYSSRTLGFERASSTRYSSRRARTLESIASLYEEDGMRHSVEESQRIQRLYAHYFDLVVINEDFDETFRRVNQAVEALSTDHQWVPVSWVY